MGRLTVRLPNSLHRQLEELARQENVSLNQYILYALTRQVSQAYTVARVPESEVERQAARFQALLDSLAKGSSQEIRAALEEREVTSGEPVMAEPMVQALQDWVAQELAQRLNRRSENPATEA